MNPYPVYRVLEEAAAKWPCRDAVHDEWGSITFGELFSEAETLRNFLIGAGISEGHGIGLKAANGRNFIVGLFAIAGCGAVVLPVYHQLRKSEIAHILEDAGLHGLLDDHSGPLYFESPLHTVLINGRIFSYDATERSRSKKIAPHVEQPAFIRYTSGTTGDAKGVVISHKSAVERVDAANQGLQLGADDTVIWVLPMAYHFVVSILLYVRVGAAIAVVKDFLAGNIIQTTNRYSGTLLYATPIQIKLLAGDTSGKELGSLRRVISTSAGIAADVCADFKLRYGIDVSQAYGIIEIGLPILNYSRSADRPDAVGYAQPGYAADILDDAYNPIEDGLTGYLGIKGPGMFDAYLNPPVLSSDVLKNGYFITADYAYKAEGLIIVAGRSKSVINISGIKIFPEEVESVLESFPGVEMARVISTPHPLLGSIIEAEIVTNSEVKVSELVKYARINLSNFKAPQRITVVDSLPVTATGKLKRT